MSSAEEFIIEHRPNPGSTRELFGDPKVANLVYEELLAPREPGSEVRYN
jgi:hypothetical protein